MSEKSKNGEMVERVAMAIEEAVFRWQPGTGQRIKDVSARAAIEAMREPTGEMTSAGDEKCGIFKHADSTWRAMIDAALK